jgi:uncharacterized membrane protein YbaN (DUF454 family)
LLFAPYTCRLGGKKSLRRIKHRIHLWRYWRGGGIKEGNETSPDMSSPAISRRDAMRIVWLILGFTSLALGALGIVLPLLPATPLIILAAFFFAKSSPAMHDWLLKNRTFGKAIRDWRERRAISRKGKIAAIVAMALTLVLSIALDTDLKIVAIQALALCGAATFILTRNTA